LGHEQELSKKNKARRNAINQPGGREILVAFDALQKPNKSEVSLCPDPSADASAAVSTRDAIKVLEIGFPLGK
jgi:hypothetical protein